MGGDRAARGRFVATSNESESTPTVIPLPRDRECFAGFVDQELRNPLGDRPSPDAGPARVELRGPFLGVTGDHGRHRGQRIELGGLHRHGRQLIAAAVVQHLRPGLAQRAGLGNRAVVEAHVDEHAAAAPEQAAGATAGKPSAPACWSGGRARDRRLRQLRQAAARGGLPGDSTIAAAAPEQPREGEREGSGRARLAPEA